ncbi:hypothetical protein TNIN_128101 [Trichonephila inaurata madagascariensis]|uniref:Uncharacterized protein n=1 Tax=Trichonephila inaurata madagascariensis TaxID=2747483 RepID=A0A8X6Y451_9ARAC|nr:hypothetical protein TNIN_378581 [Trichonephila inaurata madagascariensis]GFY62579.1 hypothetical protein TNIN_128101 [Trichonephila inaurata madagascariensis]
MPPLPKSQKENEKRNEIKQANAAKITSGLSFAQAIIGKNSQQRAPCGNESSTSNVNNSKNNGLNLEALMQPIAMTEISPSYKQYSK